MTLGREPITKQRRVLLFFVAKPPVNTDGAARRPARNKSKHFKILKNICRP